MKKHFKIITNTVFIIIALLLTTAFQGVTSNARYDTQLNNFLQQYRNTVAPENTTQQEAIFTEAYFLLLDAYVNPTDDDFKEKFFKSGYEILNTITKAKQQKDANLNPEHTEIIQDATNNSSLPNNQDLQNITASQTMEVLMAVMLNSVDAHTAWLSPKSADSFKNRLTGNYKGIGISFLSVQEGNYLEIKKVFAKSGAERAGLQAKDRIYFVDDVRVDLGKDYKNLTKIVDSIKGEKDTYVKLTIKRPRKNGGLDTLEIKTQRGDYYIPSVEHKIIKNKYAYINISSFNQDTYSLFTTALDRFNFNNLQGLIIDLRGNPGGLLKQALAVADTILSGEEIVSVKGRDPSNSDSFYSFKRTYLDSNIPIVMLIDNQSASASELISASIALNNRAILMGDYSFGKWSVQISRTLSNNSIFNITTQLFYAPFNVTFQGEGIAPDINILPPQYFNGNQLVSKDKIAQLRKKEFRESSYKNALPVKKVNAINRKPQAVINQKMCPEYNKDSILGCAMLYLDYKNINTFYNAVNNK